MALQNTWLYTKAVVLGEKILADFENQFKVLDRRPYSDSRGRYPDGYRLNLKVLKDNGDLGVDKNGIPRMTNVEQTFDVIVLDKAGCAGIVPGDYIAIDGLNEQASYVINFDLGIFFDGAHVLKKASSPNG